MDTFTVLLTYIIPGLVAILFGVIGFQIRNLYKRVDRTEENLRKVEIDLATNSEQNRGLMLRLDQIGNWCESIESKLDRVITDILQK
tara:strand:- start:6056 stop:6316 length:261 start_codon:yes stop_codon:yes gene_type:complete